MTLRQTTILAALVGLTGLSWGGDGPTELKKLQGSWEVVEIITGGEAVPVQKGDVSKVVITDKQITFTSPKGVKKQMAAEVKAMGKPIVVDLSVGGEPMVQFLMDPTASPKSLDYTVWTPYGPTAGPKGIYKVEGDVWWLCMSKDRPKDFNSSKGSGQTLIKLKRIKS